MRFIIDHNSSTFLSSRRWEWQPILDCLLFLVCQASIKYAWQFIDKYIKLAKVCTHLFINQSGGVSKSMLASDVTIIDIKEHQIEYFKVIIKLLRETTGLSNGSSQSVSKATVITFYAYRMLLADLFLVRLECGCKAIPVIHANRTIADFQLFKTGS